MGRPWFGAGHLMCMTGVSSRQRVAARALEWQSSGRCLGQDAWLQPRCATPAAAVRRAPSAPPAAAGPAPARPPGSAAARGSPPAAPAQRTCGGGCVCVCVRACVRACAQMCSVHVACMRLSQCTRLRAAAFAFASSPCVPKPLCKQRVSHQHRALRPAPLYWGCPAPAGQQTRSAGRGTHSVGTPIPDAPHRCAPCCSTPSCGRTC